MRPWGYLVVSAMAVLFVAGCSTSKAEPKVVDVKAVDMSFGPKELTVKKGQPVRIVFNNQDIQLHDFSIDKIPAKGGEGHDGGGHDMGGKKPDVHTSADAGKTGEVEFTPTQAGKYQFYCTVAGHKDAGMVGTLIVE